MTNLMPGLDLHQRTRSVRLAPLFILDDVGAGLVAGISFLEAPLKFTAPGITVPLGLGIGRLVFQALNKVEIGLAVLAVVAAFQLTVPQGLTLPLGLLVAVLAAQTLWLLPALDVRALAILAGKTPPASSMHYVYIGAEVFKLLLLLGTANRTFALLSRPAQAWRLRHA